ncbi:hypothetical protein M0805_008719 [Coniferiporia weirii]|nr:hypothetical protein M0805_008719 [Coniferiporia weirii]
MSLSSINVEDIDIMSDSLSLLGEDVSGLQDDGLVKYGELVLNIAPKAVTLLADQLFSPSLLIAERIERGMISLEGKTVVELGAGCALPSILAATLPRAGPSLVVITDYPDESILANVRINVHANERLVAPSCSVACEGHEWGTDVTPLLNILSLQNPRTAPYDRGFDIVLLSDLLHFHNSHPAILSSLTGLLSRSSSARAYIAAGTYTPPHVCNNFVRLAEGAGLVMEEGAPDDIWRGSCEVWRVGRLSVDELGIRKAMCRWWTARWDEHAFDNASQSS